MQFALVENTVFNRTIFALYSVFLFNHSGTIKGKQVDFGTILRPFGALTGSIWTKNTLRIHF